MEKLDILNTSDNRYSLRLNWNLLIKNLILINSEDEIEKNRIDTEKYINSHKWKLKNEDIINYFIHLFHFDNQWLFDIDENDQFSNANYDNSSSLNWIYFNYEVEDLKTDHWKDFFLHSFKRNFVEEIFNTSNLEWNHLTIIETKTILDWVSVWWKRLEDIEMVKNLEKWNRFIHDKSKWNFEFTKDFFCSLHDLIWKEEALIWWKFRNWQVYITWLDRDVTHFNDLEKIFNEWKNYFDNFSWNDLQKAFLIFLWWSYHQFFFDCNKRTSRWFCNHLLLSNWYFSLMIYYEDQLEYNRVMMNLYETWNADEALKFLEKTYKKNIRKLIA